MESNEVLNETMGMNTKKAEVMDMKQDKRVESLIHPAQKAYTRLNHLAVGKVSKDVRDLYRTLLEQSLAVLNGEDEEEESAIYGCEDLQKGKDSREEFLKRLIHDRKHLADYDDADSFPFGFLGEDILLPFVDDELDAAETEE